MRYFLALAATLAVVLSACGTEQEARPDFEAALMTHLDAVVGRDIEALKPTLSLTNDDLQVIFPEGQSIMGVDEVIAFHEGWFADTEWVFTPTVERIVEGKDLSMALIKYDYRDTADGPARTRWLVLVFRLEDGAWRLVHDQNTLYPEQSE